MRGAKGKYKPEMCKEAEELMAKGMLQKDVATLLGIHTSSFHDWIENKPEFGEAIKRGQARCREYHIKNITEAGKKSWQASAWYLERTNEVFKLKQELQHTGKVEISHTVNENDPVEVQKELHQFYGSALPQGSSN